MDCNPNIFYLGITFILVILVFFIFWLHLIFRKPVNLIQAIIVFVALVISVFDKTDCIFWFDNIDPLWHLNPVNIVSGFPAFFVFRYVIDFFSGGFAWYVLPLIFGALIYYVFVVWLNQKNISLIALIFLCFFLLKDFFYMLSFSREPLVIFFSLLFFYFLEKHYYKNSRKNLIAATLFLMLACLTKITGFLLIPFYLWVLTQKHRSNYYLIPLALILVFMLFKTNLAANLHAGDVVLTLSLLINSIYTFYATHLILWFFIFFPWFFKPKNFLWQVNAYAFILIFAVGLKTYFLSNTDMAITLERYLVIFVLPLILWLSQETQYLKQKLKTYYTERRETMNKQLFAVLAVFALLGWGVAGFFYLEASSYQKDCHKIIPIVEATVDYYERVCADDIERETLYQLARQNHDLNISIKT